jgi:2,4-dienoyl-CoA reductase (NADPH2)
MSGNAYQKLLEPGRIGSVTTRNRIIKTGAGLLMWHEDDIHMREEVKAFYEGIARGGVGLIIVDSPAIDYPLGLRWRNRYRLDNDKYIEGMSELVEVIHKHGCPTFMQMWHDGPWQVKVPQEKNPLYSGPPIASSPVCLKTPHDNHNEIPRALTIQEIEDLVDKFAGAAVRARKAGFDGVDVNAASSHLLHNFLSPFWNKREDVYGGSLENRARFVTDVIREIKRRLGHDFPVSVIINGIEIGQVVGVENSSCLTHEESKGIARLLEQAGADAIQIRNHWLGYHVGGFLPDALFYPEPPIPLKLFPKEYYSARRGAGANMLLAAGVKQAVSIPVIAVGRLDPELGERMLERGMADFIGMTRRLQADPDLPNKIAAGRIDDIAPCTGCDFCLGSRGRCRINGLMGTPYNTIEKAEKRKKILVIGGGPAGMEAARVSALRGHDVILYEKSCKLGGLLPLAATVKGTQPEDLPSLIRYLEGQIKKLGVQIECGKTVDASTVEKIKPDVVFVATGGIPTIPEIQGINGRNVVNGGTLHRMLKIFLKFLGPKRLRQLSALYLPLGRRVAIIGGAIQGCELAEFLTKRGRKVTIVEKADILGEGMTNIMREHLMMWFERKGVTMITGVREYAEITDRGLTVIVSDGSRLAIEVDTVVPALPLAPDTTQAENLKGMVAEVYAIGDCILPAQIADAIGSAMRMARIV